jgi:ribosomal protein S18 acetylase RimI-like enzyme
MHPLDNVIWQALTTRQREFAESFAGARRFPREVTSLSAFVAPSQEGYRSLAGLVGQGGTTAVFLDDPYQPREGWELLSGAPLLEMICETGSIARGVNREFELLELGAQDSTEMVELTQLTKPGPFGTRTHELGDYLGIRQQGKLVALAGERLKVPGFTEVSAVCTHPDHAGKGYARALLLEVMRRICERGETPMLHVRRDHTRAVELYLRLGFRTRATLHYAVLRHTKNKGDD